ncbi:PH-like domain-containing protein [Streptomyces calidiresistens]
MPFESLVPPGALAVERPEIHWPGYISWTIGMLLVVVLLYWLMSRGWARRGSFHSDLPELPVDPAPDAPARMVLRGRYFGSTTTEQWLDRIVTRGLGTRSTAELTLTDHGVRVVRPGARDFFVPADRLIGARLDRGIAGKVLTDGGLLVLTWRHGERVLDSGFRSDRAEEHRAWLEAVNRTAAEAAEGGRPAAPTPAPVANTGTDDASGPPAGTTGPHDQEGAR